MTLSDTASRILAEAALHPLRLAALPDKLPIAAARAVLNNLLKQGYVEECKAPDEFAGLRWHQQDGTKPTVRISEAGMAAIGVASAGVDPAASATLTGTEGTGTGPELADTAEERGSGRLVAPIGAGAAQTPSTRASLRDAALGVLAAWDGEASERAGLADAIAALRAILVKPAPAPRKPREGTKQQQVLALLRRPEGATVAQIAEAAGWQPHTVRGFFVGLKKRGIEVSVLERVRQVGPNKQGAKGSYTVYQISE